MCLGKYHVVFLTFRSLHSTFTLQTSEWCANLDVTSQEKKKIRRKVKHPHEHFQVVEIVGYYGRTSKVKRAVYFFENAISFKKLIVDPRLSGFRTNIDSK
ncbi:putative FBD domain-containing protein [Helianthus annuus]|nr:putative FBD domain-containing protein [Helianthus annuus]